MFTGRQRMRQPVTSWLFGSLWTVLLAEFPLLPRRFFLVTSMLGFAVSTPRAAMRWRSETLITLLRKHDLFVTTTYHEGTACQTWRHARYWTTGHGAQIDHICTCRFLSSKVRRSFVVSSTQLATTVVSDHDM
eukprot:4164478-Amphidinium_carterae.1